MNKLVVSLEKYLELVTSCYTYHAISILYHPNNIGIISNRV